MLAGILAGCATTEPKVHPDPNVYADVVWPEVALFHKEPSDELRSRCTEFHNSSVLRQCDMRFLGLNHELEQFKKSNYFADVKFSDRGTDYVIAITKARFIDEDMGDIAKGALAGATLLLVPVTMSQEVDVEAAILWRGTVIREMKFDVNFNPTMSLYHNPEQAKIDVAGEIAANIIEDINSEDVLSGQYLAKTLQASDYTRDLVVPDQAGEYSRAGEIVLGNPLDGVALSYARPEFQFDEYVITIYPIRDTSWIDYAAVLADELELIRADFAIAVKEGIWREATFGDRMELLIDAPGGGNTGIMQPMNLVNASGEQFIGRIYMFIKEDKIVCISNFVPVGYDQPDSQAFLSMFFGGLQVPGESLYMAKLRQQQRKYELQ